MEQAGGVKYVRKGGSSGVPFRFEKRFGTKTDMLELYSTWDEGEAERAEIKRAELKRAEFKHAGSKLEAELKEALDTGGQCASLVGGMLGTKGKLKEERKWSNWIRQLVNGSNKFHCNDLWTVRRWQSFGGWWCRLAPSCERTPVCDACGRSWTRFAEGSGTAVRSRWRARARRATNRGLPYREWSGRLGRGAGW